MALAVGGHGRAVGTWQRPAELLAPADAKLRVHLAEVELEGARADEPLHPVGSAARPHLGHRQVLAFRRIRRWAIAPTISGAASWPGAATVRDLAARAVRAGLQVQRGGERELFADADAPAGAECTHCGSDGLRAFYAGLFANGGGITLDDGAQRA
jgi:hypothetical protein